jgi:hypothetical protein
MYVSAHMNMPNFTADVVLGSSKRQYSNSKINFMRRESIVPALDTECYLDCIEEEDQRCHSLWIQAILHPGLYNAWKRCDDGKDRRCKRECR